MEQVTLKQKAGRHNTMNELSWAYLAGLFDGEGCIVTMNSNQPSIVITNTNKELIDFLVAKLGGKVYKVPHSKTGNSENWKIGYHWVLAKRHEVYIALSLMLPHLIVKKQKSLEALETIRLHGRKKTLDKINNFDCAVIHSYIKQTSNQDK
jgi:hypothetical protein